MSMGSSLQHRVHLGHDEGTSSICTVCTAPHFCSGHCSILVRPTADRGKRRDPSVVGDCIEFRQFATPHRLVHLFTRHPRLPLLPRPLVFFPAHVCLDAAQIGRAHLL